MRTTSIALRSTPEKSGSLNMNSRVAMDFEGILLLAAWIMSSVVDVDPDEVVPVVAETVFDV